MRDFLAKCWIFEEKRGDFHLNGGFLKRKSVILGKNGKFSKRKGVIFTSMWDFQIENA